VLSQSFKIANTSSLAVKVSLEEILGFQLAHLQELPNNFFKFDSFARAF